MHHGPVVIVTGAGSGIGRAVCLQLAAEGCRIALVGRDRNKLERTGELMTSNTKDAIEWLLLPTDVSDRKQIDSLIAAVMKKWGRIDALINNAAILPPSTPIDQVDQETLQRSFAVNTFGPAHLIAAVWPTFVKQRGGRIVNVSSMATIDPFPGLSVYAASKAAMESLTRSIMNEGSNLGILAFTVAPGAVETDMLRSLIPESDLPRDRVLDPATVAAIIVSCALGRNDDKAGQVITLRNK